MSLHFAIDDLTSLLNNVLLTLPSLRDEPLDLQTTIIEPFFSRSDIFCRSLSTGCLSISTGPAGGSSCSGHFRVLGETITARTISWSGGRWITYYLPVYAKQLSSHCQSTSRLSLTGRRSNQGAEYQASDSMLEALIGRLTSHLFELGVAPSALMYYGLYSCRDGNCVFLMEQGNLEVFELLGGYNYYSTPVMSSAHEELFLATSAADYQVWLTQLLHTLYVFKRHYGLVHGDLHLRNILLTRIRSDRLPSVGSLSSSHCGTEPLSKVDGYRYQLPFRVDASGEIGAGELPAAIIVPNNGYLPKIIDWGIASADLSRSASYPIDCILRNPSDIYANYFMSEQVCLDKNHIGDVDANYMICSWLFQWTRLNEGLLTQASPRVIDHARSIYPLVREFLLNLLIEGGFSPLILDNLRDHQITGLHRGRTFNRNPFDRLWDRKTPMTNVRAVGTTSDITDPLRRLWIVLKSVYPVKISDSAEVIITNQVMEHIITIPLVTSPYFNTLNYLLAAHSKQSQFCGSSTELCGKAKSVLRRFDPDRRLHLDFFRSLVTPQSLIWDSATGRLQFGIRVGHLARFERLRQPGLRLYQLKLIPEWLLMKRLGHDETVEYQNSQRTTLYQPPAVVGISIEAITCHLLYLHRDLNANISVAQNDLYHATKNMRRGVAVNGGFFIVSSNISNRLTPGLESLAGYPIGYFYSHNQPQFIGTALPVPRYYQNRFATIIVNEQGRLDMMTSEEFLAAHECSQRDVRYLVDGKIYNTQQKIINITDGHPVIKSPTLKYQSAFESGPILIWDGQLLFTREVMISSELRVDLVHDVPTTDEVPSNGNLYRLSSRAKTSSSYSNAPGEYTFLYGQRSSVNLQIHNILCQTRSGNWLVVFIEGRGFDAIGLDRAQAAALVTHFDVVRAVALDGGFSANAVIAMEEKRYWLLNDPEHRRLSTIITFTPESKS